MDEVGSVFEALELIAASRGRVGLDHWRIGSAAGWNAEKVVGVGVFGRSLQTELKTRGVELSNPVRIQPGGFASLANELDQAAHSAASDDLSQMGCPVRQDIDEMSETH